MKRVSFVLLIIATVTAVSVATTQLLPRSGQAASAQQASAAGHTISAWGHGEVAVNPDQAWITLGVQSRAKEARRALSGNSAKITSVIIALTKQGVAKARIQTNNLSLWYDSQGSVYVATHNLSVQLDRVDRVGTVLDAAIAAGANNSFGVSFGVKDPSTARASALKAAVADARKRATSLAQALGTSIIQATSIDEATFGNVIKGGAQGMGGGGGTPIQPGQYVVSADVNVTYGYR